MFIPQLIETEQQLLLMKVGNEGKIQKQPNVCTACQRYDNERAGYAKSGRIPANASVLREKTTAHFF